MTQDILDTVKIDKNRLKYMFFIFRRVKICDRRLQEKANTRDSKIYE